MCSPRGICCLFVPPLRGGTQSVRRVGSCSCQSKTASALVLVKTKSSRNLISRSTPLSILFFRINPEELPCGIHSPYLSIQECSFFSLSLDHSGTLRSYFLMLIFKTGHLTLYMSCVGWGFAGGRQPLGIRELSPGPARKLHPAALVLPPVPGCALLTVYWCKQILSVDLPFVSAVIHSLCFFFFFAFFAFPFFSCPSNPFSNFIHFTLS